jgi:hypothetical protein
VEKETKEGEEEDEDTVGSHRYKKSNDDIMNHYIFLFFFFRLWPWMLMKELIQQFLGWPCFRA